LKSSIKYIFTWILTSLAFYSYSQCTIVSNNEVCLGDFIGFTVNLSSGTATSYSWDFGDNSSSNNSNPIHTYATDGKMTVKVTVTLSGGGTCTATKEIDVYPLPKAKFEYLPLQSDSCLFTNNICIENNSDKSSAGIGFSKIIALWGDGAGTIDSIPITSNKYCHKYNSPNSYTITMEVTDLKGCKSKASRVVKVLPDISAEFELEDTGDCTQVKLCLKNRSTGDTLNITNLLWTIGSSTTSSPYSEYCRTITQEGTYPLKLFVEHKDGCTDSFVQSYTFNIDTSSPTININKREACYGDEFLFRLTGNTVPGADYEWGITDSLGDYVRKVLGKTKTEMTLPDPGVYYVSYLVNKNGCKNVARDSFYVLGPRADFDALNSMQCLPEDTVFFVDKSNWYRSYDHHWKWNFGDFRAPQCTSHRKKNQNVNMNCNFSLDSLSKHFYDTTDCFDVRLIVYDSITGCRDSLTKPVTIKSPEKLPFKHGQGDDPFYCVGDQVKIYIDSLDKYLCIIPPNLIKYDSAKTNQAFLPMKYSNIYFTPVLDSNGWVTLAVVHEGGSIGYYTSWDTASFVVDSSKLCVDTFYYNKFLNVSPIPDASFHISEQEGCGPQTVTIKYNHPNQKHLDFLYINWDDGNSTTDTLPNYDSLGTYTHTYSKAGHYTISTYIEDWAECSGSYGISIEFGYFKDFYLNDKICAGDTVFFQDSVTYLNDTTQYWRNPGRPEKISWDYGDGAGFSHFSTGAFHIYDTIGEYTVRMATEDKTGCRDTISKKVTVNGVKANFILPRARQSCDEITRFFDSSYLVIQDPSDSISKWEWSFGDGKNNSQLKDPFHYYSSFGKFKINLKVENTYGCVDSIEKVIELDGPLPEFEIISDTVGCVPFTAQFKNTSKRVKNWIWYFGDPNNSQLSTNQDTVVEFTYTTPGTYYIYLYGADSFFNNQTNAFYFCSSLFPDSTSPFAPVRKVTVLPIPEVDFTIPDTVCRKELFELHDNSSNTYTNFIWDMGNGDSIVSNLTPEYYAYQDTGYFTVNYTPTYTPLYPEHPICRDSSSKRVYVLGVDVKFDINTLLSDEPEFYFTNTSPDQSIQFVWNYGHPISGEKNTSNGLNGFHDYYSDTGTFEVCLVGTNSRGCKDTFCREVRNTFFPYLILYNVFTPGKDGLNDAYDVEIFGQTHYNLKIYNRWGNLVFESSEDGDGNDGNNWNGKIFNEGEECPEGTYFYIFNYQFKERNAKIKTANGTVNLIRE
jgi:gliding motility-associated-like protein